LKLNCERNPENLKIENLCRNFIKQSRMAGVYFSITPSHVFSESRIELIELVDMISSCASWEDKVRFASRFQISTPDKGPGDEAPVPPRWIVGIRRDGGLWASMSFCTTRQFVR
jgi:hypothetical protein